MSGERTLTWYRGENFIHLNESLICIRITYRWKHYFWQAATRFDDGTVRQWSGITLGLKEAVRQASVKIAIEPPKRIMAARR